VVFPDFFLRLTSSFIVVWSEKMHGVTLVFFNLLTLVLWPNMWSLLENVPRALEKNVYSTVLGWNVLNIILSPSGPVCHSKALFPC